MSIEQTRLDEIKAITKELENKSLQEIAQENKIKIIVGNLSDIGDGKISGAIVKIHNDKDYDYAIYINSSERETRQNFTLAHELGHYFLHKDKIDSLGAMVDNNDKYLFREDIYSDINNEKRIREEEANEFAANLLMPENKVKYLWNITKDVSALAEAFNVSISAMSYRIYKLKLEDE